MLLTKAKLLEYCILEEKNPHYLPGTDVPRATKTTAVTVSLRPTVQPKWEARSPIMAVKKPMTEIDTMKQAQPFQYCVGGTQANRIFQKTHNMCIK